ncbi:MAG TPA: ABC transporter permease [Anaerolineae bacterium]|nr:ABC transporter permease [Anaerolineae bacterium]
MAANTDRSAARRRTGLPFKVQFEPRLAVPRWLPITVSLAAIVLALLLGAAALRFSGITNPFGAYGSIARELFGTWGGISDVLVQATPLILVGLACSVAFSMKLWNIGAEGQFFIGAFAASAIVLAPVLPAETPGWVFIPVMMIAGFIGGALWGFVPGFLKAKLNVNEVITTLMMNYIAIEWNNFFIFGVWSERGFQMSPRFPRTAWLPRLADYAKQMPQFGGLTLHLGLLFGPLAAGVVWWLLYRSKWGYEIRLAGDNPKAARYAGTRIARNTILVMMLSGGLAGLAGMAQIGGVVRRLQGAISPGYGFTGIIIAWLSKLNPFVVVLVSILFGALLLAGREIGRSGISMLIQGIILFALIASEFLLRNRVRIVRTGEG